MTTGSEAGESFGAPKRNDNKKDSYRENREVEKIMERKNILRVLKGIAALLLLSLPFGGGAVAQFNDARPGPGWCPWMMGGTWGWIGMIFMILFWVLILLGVIALIRWMMSSRRDSTSMSLTSNDSAAEILKRRYAKGEISKEQYETMRHDLGEG